MRHEGPRLRGRDAERQLLQARVGAAREHGHGCVVLLTGPAGSGKSRLLQEARRLAQQAGARVVQLSGDPDAHVIPHGPLLDAARSGPDPLLPQAALQQLPRGPEQGFWLGNELESRLAQLASRVPVMVCVDDLQWCDPATLRLLRTLPQRLATEAIVWVLAVRHGESAAAVEATSHALLQAGGDLLALEPLDDGAVRAITADLLGAAPDSRVLASVARAGGQPLLLVELLRGLLAEQLVRVHDGSAALVSDEVPALLRDAVARRTRRLSAAARELMQVAAVLGRRFPADLLAAVLDRKPPTLLGPLQEVIDAGLLTDDGEHIGFRHDLIREVVAASMPAGFARVLRRHAAEVLLARGTPALHVATMLAESATHGDLRAVATLRDAAAELASTSAAEAARFSVRAVELLPEESPLRAEVVVESIMLLWQSGRASAAQELASTMLAGTLGTDSAAEARIRLGLARFAARYSSAEAIRQCETALALPGLPDSLRVQLQLVLAVNHGLAGDPESADVALGPVVERLGRVPDPVLGSALARAQSYVAFHRRQWDLAFRRHDDVERLASSTDETSPAPMWEAAMWTSIGHPRRALSLIDPELASARRDGRVGSLLMWSSMRARALYDAGRLEESRAEAETVLDMEDVDVVGGLRDLLVAYVLVRVGLDTGRPDLVRAHRARVQQMTTEATGQIRRNGLWLQALIADRAGDTTAAMSALAEAVTMFGRPGPSLAGLPDVHDEVVFVRTALRAGHRQLATRAVEAAERRAWLNPTYPTAAAAARHARALLDADAACLREALAVMGDERPLVRASALEDLGRMLAPDRRREAVALLDDAAQLYDGCGAEHHAARVRTRLRRLGVRRRRAPEPEPPQHGLAALTPGERAVVRLVAEGGTNRQVAQQLFLSPHTVNTHLRNAFGKLQVRSRVELTRVVASEEDA